MKKRDAADGNSGIQRNFHNATLLIRIDRQLSWSWPDDEPTDEPTNEPVEPAMFKRLDDNSADVDARIYIDELNRLMGLNLPVQSSGAACASS